MQDVLKDKGNYKVTYPKVPSREEQATNFVVYVKTFWDKSYPLINCSRNFMDKHFPGDHINQAMTEFGRRQYVKVGTLGKTKKWVEYRGFAHFEAGNNV